jgi:DNA-binding CsgD family transcriptional regulator
LQVLRLVADGNSSKDLAVVLNPGLPTVPVLRRLLLRMRRRPLDGYQ